MSFITTDTLPTYKLGQASIPWVDSTKYLGPLCSKILILINIFLKR